MTTACWCLALHKICDDITSILKVRFSGFCTCVSLLQRIGFVWVLNKKSVKITLMFNRQLSCNDWNYSMIYAGFWLACCSQLCRVITACHFRVTALSGALVFSLSNSLSSWIEFNFLWSATVDKVAGLSIDRKDSAHRLVFPLQQVTLAQVYKYHHQSDNVAS